MPPETLQTPRASIGPAESGTHIRVDGEQSGRPLLDAYA